VQRLMLLDSNSLIYRAYFALINTPLTTSKGELVNAVFGFWSIVLRGFQDVKPDYVIACFDLAGPTFRHQQYAEYKATRRQMPDDLRDQFPIVREVIEAFGIPIYQLQGFEADDLIATLVRQAESREVETTIVSGDLDLLQIVSDRTTLMTTRGGVQQTTFYDPAKVMERYGLRPEQMTDFKALKGDSTDNIPGIAGVGEKTAAKLVQDYGSIEELLTRAERLTRAQITAIPDGDYAFEDWLDDDGVTIGRPVKIAVTLRVRGSSMTFDFTGSDPQVGGPFNSVPASTMSDETSAAPFATEVPAVMISA